MRAACTVQHQKTSLCQLECWGRLVLSCSAVDSVQRDGVAYRVAVTCSVPSGCHI